MYFGHTHEPGYVNDYQGQTQRFYLTQQGGLVNETLTVDRIYNYLLISNKILWCKVQG